MAPSDDSAAAIHEHGDCVTLQLQVQPRAARARFGPLCGAAIKVAVLAPPAEGAANLAVATLVAQVLGLRLSDVVLLTGSRGRRKLVRARGTTREAVLKALEAAPPGRARRDRRG
ncbi:MAG: DUF167 domain-containing protein [Proteobacteria bacterium]|nr:DUF167 domain-containing protein [Pseudomonadota bacterium]